MSAVKNPLAIRVAKLKEFAATARERLAADLFEVGRVELAMSEVAGQGFTTLTVTPERALDLRSTAAARELVAQLTAAGARCEWEPRRTNGPENVTAYALVITW